MQSCLAAAHCGHFFAPCFSCNALILRFLGAVARLADFSASFPIANNRRAVWLVLALFCVFARFGGGYAVLRVFYWSALYLRSAGALCLFSVRFVVHCALRRMYYKFIKCKNRLAIHAGERKSYKPGKSLCRELKTI